jgi:hypothetical protein
MIDIKLFSGYFPLISAFSRLKDDDLTASCSFIPKLKSSTTGSYHRSTAKTLDMITYLERSNASLAYVPVYLITHLVCLQTWPQARTISSGFTLYSLTVQANRK